MSRFAGNVTASAVLHGSAHDQAYRQTEDSREKQMSNRTIVEFNHDYAGEIDRDPEGFLRAVRAMLNSGVNDSESSKRDALEKFGVATSPTHHHSSKSEVILRHEGGREYWRKEFT
jgi:hypothetical protein